LLEHYSHMQQLDINYVKTVITRLKGGAMQSFTDMIAAGREKGSVDNFDELMDSARQLGEWLYQSKMAFASIESPLRLQQVKNDAGSSRFIKAMKDRAPQISELKIELNQLIREFTEANLARYSTDPEVIYGIVKVLDPTVDENMWQEYLNAASYSNNKVMSLSLKEFGLIMKLGKEKHQEDKFQLDSLIEAYNGSTQLSKAEWESMLERNEDGKIEPWFLKKGSQNQLNKIREARVQMYLKQPNNKTTEADIRKTVQNELIEEGYINVDSTKYNESKALAKAKRDASIKANPVNEAVAENIYQDWLSQNTRYGRDGTAVPNWKYEEPNSDMDELMARNSEGKTIDDYIDKDGKPKNEFGAILKYVSETFKKLADLSNRRNMVSNGRLAVMINEESLSMLNSIGEGEWQDASQKLLRKIGYTAVKTETSTLNLDNTVSSRLEFEYIDRLVDYRSPFNINKKRGEKGKDNVKAHEARVLEEAKLYLAENNITFKDLKYKDAVALHQMFVMGKRLKLTIGATTTTSIALRHKKKVVGAINKFYEGAFGAKDWSTLLLVDRLISKRNHEYTEANQAMDIKSMFNLFSLTSRMYEAKQIAGDRLLLSAALLNDPDNYEIKKLENTGKVKTVLASLDEKRRKTFGGGKHDSKVRYHTTRSSRVAEHMNETIQMIYYNNFDKNEGEWSKIAKVIQNYTSAKNMWWNLTGALNNVAYGKMQMAMEMLAGEFTNPGDKSGVGVMADATITYNSALGSYLSDVGEYATTLQSGLIKRFDVVQLQDEKAYSLEHQRQKQKKNLLKHHFSNYALYHAGEHAMQNQMLFAMLKSHRVIDGRIMNLNGMLLDPRYEALLELGHKSKLNNYIDDAMSKDTGYIERSRLIQKYILGLSTEEASEVVKLSQDKIKTTTEEFVKAPTLYELFELKNGKAQINQTLAKEKGVSLRNGELAQFGTNVEKTNQRVHGIYNKLDANIIQRTAVGKLVMHFRKWYKPSLDRRIGSKPGKAYWNEALRSKDKGTFIAFGQYLHDLIKFFNNYGLVYHTFDLQDQAAIKAAAVEAMEIFMIGLIYGTAMSFDLDDDDDNAVAGVLLYQTRRLYDELTQFTPFGVIDQVAQFQDSPVAAQKTFMRLGALFTHIGKGFFDGNWTYEAGIYAKENKVQHDIIDATPIIRQVDRFWNNRFSSYNKINYGFNTLNYIVKDKDEE